MSAEESTRVGVYTWSDGGDPFTRDQMNTSHQNIEDRVAIFLSGPIASRPVVPSGEAARMFYLSTDENSPVGILYYSDGSDWQTLNSFGAPVSESPGDSQSTGSASTLARSDHRHQMLPWGVVGEVAATSTSSAAGTTAKYARIDHVHQVGNNSVTAGKIAPGGVSSANQLANNVVTTAAIQNQAVTQDKLDPNALIPTGTILPWAGESSTPPQGWLFCDGSVLEKSAYSDLYDVIGDKYAEAFKNTGQHPVHYYSAEGSQLDSVEGALPASNKFRIPDLRIRFPLGNSVMNNAQLSPAIDRLVTADPVTLSKARNAFHYESDSSNKLDKNGTVNGTASQPVLRAANAGDVTFQNVSTMRSRRYTDAVLLNDVRLQTNRLNNSDDGINIASMPPFVTTQYIIKY